VAAGLNAAATPGTLVLADRVVDTLPLEQKGGGLESTKLWTDRVAARLPASIRVLRGPIGATDRVLSTWDEKRVAGSTGAIAADMETEQWRGLLTMPVFRGCRPSSLRRGRCRAPVERCARN